MMSQCTVWFKTTLNKEVLALILVIDDSEDMQALVKRALTKRNYQVVLASNGEAALEQIKSQLPSLILLDMRMPVMNGWQFVKNFRNLYGRRVPIVVMTAEEDSRLRADQVGADSYLGKPFESEELYQVVEDTVIDEE